MPSARLRDDVLHVPLSPCCPECLREFVPTQPTQLFCTPAHRVAWGNRMTVRGRVATPLLIAARLTRGGSRGDHIYGARATRESDALIRHYRAEDAADGRMGVLEYVRRRYLLGFDPL